MGRLSRRQFTSLLGSAAAVSVSGCTEAFGEYLGNDQKGELLVVTTNLRTNSTPDGGGEYPKDIEARVVVENRRSKRQQATLETTLRHDPPDGTTEEWTKTREFDLGRGVSPTVIIIFRSVFEDGDELKDFEVEAGIIEANRVDSESAQ